MNMTEEILSLLKPHVANKNQCILLAERLQLLIEEKAEANLKAKSDWQYDEGYKDGYDDGLVDGYEQGTIEGDISLF
jgi:flagellar biosynthesis/type III secretory pathway protein FliH